MLAVGVRTTAPEPVLAAAGADLIVPEVGKLIPEDILVRLRRREAPQGE